MRLRYITSSIFNFLISLVNYTDCIAQPSEAPTIQESIITVIGKRPATPKTESQRGLSTGSSTTIIPQESSRFESKELLKKDSTFSFKETGRMNGSGFTVPQIRGQDAKLTEIYINETLVQNPYTGLPTSFDLDLRAFGRIDIFQGISSYTIPSTNPIGTLKYHKAKQRFPHQLGTSYGIPQGHTVWTINNYEKRYSNSQITYSLYSRIHQTDGKFSYYNDNGTPYKVSDDYESVRNNNHHRSVQIIPYIGYSKKKWRLSLMGISQQAESGLTGPINSEGSSTEDSLDQFVDANNQYIFGDYNSFVPYKITLSINQGSNKRKVTDPTGELLGFASSNVITTHNTSINSGVEHKGNIYGNKMHLSLTQSTIGADSSAQNNFVFSRKSASIYSGGSIEVNPNWSWEYKGSFLNITDSDNLRTTTRRANGKNLSTSYHTNYLNSYLQYGIFERIPTLFEEFGDGGYIKSSEGLETERIDHREIGALLHSQNKSKIIGMSYFEDRTDNKIRFLPSFGQTLKAQNLDSTKISGINAFIELTYSSLGGSLNISQLKAEDLSFPNTKSIANIPEFKGIMSFYKKWHNFVLRWTTHERSKVYRDRRNSIEIPGARTHDLNADYSLVDPSQKISLGMAVLNIFDLKKIGISAPDSPTNNGATGYSDYYGFPLPGRSFKVSVNWQL